MKKILIVLTSWDALGTSGRKTGFWLSELTHFHKEISAAGFGFDLMSPMGGKPPMDESSRDMKDPVNKAFMDDPALSSRLSRTLKPDQVRPADYAAVYYVGGHGAIWDLARDEKVAAIAGAVYGSGGVLSAVCHGPAGLLPVRTPEGKSVLAGKNVTGFSDLEEGIVRLTQFVPSLEKDLKKLGARYSRAFLPFVPYIIVDGRLITGQNPASAPKLGKALVELLNSEKKH